MPGMHNMEAITIFKYELKLQEYDLGWVLDVGRVLVILQRSSDSQDKLILALLEMNSVIHIHTDLYFYLSEDFHRQIFTQPLTLSWFSFPTHWKAQISNKAQTNQYKLQ